METDIPPAGQSFVTATLIIGKQPEPHLSECLACAAEAVDFAVVDYNGECRQNWEALNESKLFKEGRMRIEKSAWKDYAQARNNTLNLLPPQTTWFMRLDGDEVHFPEQLKIITKEIIPGLDENVGMLDAYWLCFFHSFKYTTKLERRHDLFVRYRPGMRWERSIHEQLIGRHGCRQAAPYVFHHYAGITSPEAFLDKVHAYFKLTNSENTLKKVPDYKDIDAYLEEHVKDTPLYSYGGSYPPDVLWHQNPDTAPAYLAEMNEKLQHLLGTDPGRQRGGKMRIIFRLLPLLLHLRGIGAKKAAIRLACQLDSCL